MMEGTWFWGNKSNIISRSGGAGTNYVSIWMDKKKYLSGGRNGMADATRAAPKAEDELDSLVAKQESDVICGVVDMLRNLNIGAKPAEVDEGALAGSGNGTEQVEVDKQESPMPGRCVARCAAVPRSCQSNARTASCNPGESSSLQGWGPAMRPYRGRGLGRVWGL